MPIHTDAHGWVLETAHTAYALGLDAGGRLVHRHFGAKLPLEDHPPPPNHAEWASFNGVGSTNPEEYPAWAGPNYVEPCLKITFEDGVRDAVLRFERAHVEGDTLEVVLRDVHYPLELRLSYRVLENFDLLERWATLENLGEAPVKLERVFSAQLHPPAQRAYVLSHLGGKWLDEFHLEREPLSRGSKVLESRRITSGHQHYPWFALDADDALEERGEVWFGALVWSGNWKLTAEATEFGTTRLSIGLNDWDFAWTLEGFETFETPRAVLGFTNGGFGAASRALHRLVRSRLPHGDAPHDVLYNSWEATAFDVSEDGQARLAEIAAGLGVELFVMDDGWFHGRNSDRAGLGDWWPDAAKFPHGLEPLIKRVNDLGMKFGLWLEPEMVSPDSDLYRAHPDWAIHFPTREATLMRNQLILNLARADVQDHLIATLSNLLERHNIAFVKWDMNRGASEPGWPGAREPRELWVRYVHGLYRVWDTLRERFPLVTFQSCSGGGGRADLGMLERADQVWLSDNTEPSARLRMQHGASFALPACAVEAWVTDMDGDWMPPRGTWGGPLRRGKLPLEFRFHASMCGVLGIGANLLEWDETEREEARALVALYKEIRPLVQQGDLHRLRSPLEHAFSALEYLAQDGAAGVVFAFRTHLPEPVFLPRVRLSGLEREARYRVDGLARPVSGAYLMEVGVQLELQDFSSALVRFERLAVSD